jgi:hypothetical protein
VLGKGPDGVDGPLAVGAADGVPRGDSRLWWVGSVDPAQMTLERPRPDHPLPGELSPPGGLRVDVDPHHPGRTTGEAGDSQQYRPGQRPGGGLVDQQRSGLGHGQDDDPGPVHGVHQGPLHRVRNARQPGPDPAAYRVGVDHQRPTGRAGVDELVQRSGLARARDACHHDERTPSRAADQRPRRPGLRVLDTVHVLGSPRSSPGRSPLPCRPRRRPGRNPSAIRGSTAGERRRHPDRTMP